MNRLTENKIVLVTRPTRLGELIARFNTAAQARFYVEHLGADTHLVHVEQALLVEHLDRDRLPAVGHDERTRADVVGDGCGEPRGVGAPAEQDSVPAAVAVAVDERIAELVGAGLRLVGVGLLEREAPRTR